MAKVLVRDTGITALVPAVLPLPRKGGKWLGGLELRQGAVAIHAGESAQDAEAFAAALRDSYDRHRAVEDARPAPDGTAERSYHRNPEYRLPTSRLVSRYAKGRGEVGTIEDEHGRRYAVPALSIVSDEGGVPLTRPEVGLAALVAQLNARKAPVRMPAPPKAKAERKAKPAPVKAPAPAGKRDACPRCGRSDFRTAGGRAWHLENAPDCRRYIKPERHTYQEVAA